MKFEITDAYVSMESSGSCITLRALEPEDGVDDARLTPEQARALAAALIIAAEQIDPEGEPLL